MEIIEECSMELEPASKVERKEVVIGPQKEIVYERQASIPLAKKEFCIPPKHVVFLSHSAEQKDFVHRLSAALQACFLHPFFDLWEDSLPIGENFVIKIFKAIKECDVGVVVLSKEFFTSKWPMMELVAMVDRAKHTKGLFKIVPVFYSITIDDIAKNRTNWMSTWKDLAKERPKGVDIKRWSEAIDYIPMAWNKLATQEPSRVEEVKMYAEALDYIRPINGLKHERKNDLELEKKIVDVVCQLAPPEIREDDFHIEGRDRLCKVIQDKISDMQKDNENGLCVVGLYGMHGCGKTSICKVLCNKFNAKFRGRVCHVELGRGSEEDLMREALKKLTGTSQFRLKEFKYDQLCMVLREGIMKDAVFLAVDNMMNTNASIAQARHYLSAKLPHGSIVMVTTHSKDSLMELRGLMDDKNYLQMPDLMEEEAKSLFMKSSGSNEVDVELVSDCIKLCHFKKGNGIGEWHYHPLALHVLGKQFESIDPQRWRVQLDKIDQDIFNRRNEGNHPLFSILRRSFDTCSPDDQLLYLDVALFAPLLLERDVLEWLSMVHNIPKAENVLSRLEGLKAKALLENLDDKVTMQIRIHELWHKFCVAQTKYGKLKHRRWVYEAKKQSEIIDTSPSLSSFWGDVKRMAFLDTNVRRLEGVNFSCFANVVVLKITGIKMTKKVVLDLRGLMHLKSLEISGSNLERLILQGLSKGLGCFIFLSNYDFWKSFMIPDSKSLEWFEIEAMFQSSFRHWKSPRISRRVSLIKQISCLTDLKFLYLVGLESSMLPNMRSMALIEVLVLLDSMNVVSLSGLSSRMTNLRKLDISWCRMLHRCPGIGDLANLEVLLCKGCDKLKELPNLQKLRKLRVLDISKCPLITELPSLGDLVALEELYAGSDYLLNLKDDASYSIKLPNMHKLSRLRVLELHLCSILVVSGFENLVSLEKLVADFRHLVDKPGLRYLTHLRDLRIIGWSSKELEDLNNLTSLKTLQIWSCEGVDKLPNLENLSNLISLVLFPFGDMDVSNISTLNPLAMKMLSIGNCYNFKNVADLGRLIGLEGLVIIHCPIESFTMGGLIEGGVQLSKLESLRLLDCKSLEWFTTHEPMNLLSRLEVEHCTNLTFLPDLCNKYFPALKKLSLEGCNKLVSLRSSGGLTTLQLLDLTNCSNLEALPNLGLFPALEELSLKGCTKITTLSSSGSVAALRVLNLDGCSGVEKLPDMELFSAVVQLRLKGCCKLTTLSSSAPLLALEVLDVRGCLSLSRDDVDQIQALCPQCDIMVDVFDLGVAKTWTWKVASARRRMMLAWGCGLPI